MYISQNLSTHNKMTDQHDHTSYGMKCENCMKSICFLPGCASRCEKEEDYNGGDACSTCACSTDNKYPLSFTVCVDCARFYKCADCRIILCRNHMDIHSPDAVSPTRGTMLCTNCYIGRFREKYPVPIRPPSPEIPSNDDTK